ncbi:hypothetical protein [Actinokineospora enzanensis]|uniref:hypothetical protein n=1 Tax=Actinokineospora enzanensis TaxID=155975 RepID=UPI00039C15B9|nr:hypothetical protein [Actinokineospora enzanensis]
MPPLSYRAQGVLAAIQDGARIDADTLAAASPTEGRKAILTALAELDAAGLIVRLRVQDKATGRWSWDCTLASAPKSPEGLSGEGNPQVEPKTPYGTSEPGRNASPQVSPKVPSRRSGTRPSGNTPQGYTPENGPNPQVSPKAPHPTSDKGTSSTSSGSSFATTTRSSSSGYARTRATLHNLNQNAVTAPAYQLVATWRQTHNTPNNPDHYTAIAHHVDTLLTRNANPDLIRAALHEFDRRPDAKPGLLPHLYDDAVKAARAAQMPPGEQHVPSGAGVPRGSTGSSRVDSALGFLSPDDPWLVGLAGGSAPELRVVEGGRGA